ncbi:unnamed protein product [Ectocarpus sp. 6 AP-2014]
MPCSGGRVCTLVHQKELCTGRRSFSAFSAGVAPDFALPRAAAVPVPSVPAQRGSAAVPVPSVPAAVGVAAERLSVELLLCAFSSRCGAC